MCHFEKENNITIALSEIKEEITLNNMHGKYNFYIQPLKNNDKITINGKGSPLTIIIPKRLNFSASETISIDLLLDSNNTKGIKFNLNANKDLECENKQTFIKRCLVPKSHFENKQNEYYNIYHLNHVNKYIKYYELSPIQVILPKDNGGSTKTINLVEIIVGSVVGGLALIGAIVFIIIYVKKRKSNEGEISSLTSGSNILPNSNKIELVDGDKFGN